MVEKTKKLTAIVLTAIMIASAFSVLPVSAAIIENDTSVVSASDTLKSGDYEYSLLDDGTVEITKYIGSVSDVTIPNMIGGKKVTSIGESSFFNCNKLTEVKIPFGVKYIQDSAFSSCNQLKRTVVPKSVVSIASDAFYACENLADITIPDSVTYIGYDAFCFCENLTDITIPNGVTYIGSGAFAGTGITNIVIPDSVTKLEGGVFCDCKKLETVKLPKTLTKIPDCMFAECYKLENVNIPNTVTKIDTQAFQNCKKLSKVNLPPTLKEIGIYAFNGCTSLKNINMPDNLKIIGAMSFCDCNLSQIHLPKSVTEIQEYALGYNDLYPDSIYFEPSKIKNFKIYGYKGAEAETYAKKNGLIFVELGNNISTPSVSSLTNTTGGIKLAWRKVDGAYGYRVYQKTSNGWKRIKDTTATSFTDSAVSANQTKTYTIRCIDKNGKTISGYNSKGWSKKYTPIAPTVSKLENTTRGIKLTWNKITGVYGYRVYTKTSSGWKKLKDTTATSLTDSAVTANQTKTYTIRCINKNGKTISGYNSKGWSKKYTASTPKITKLINTSKGVSVTWNKVTGVYGYRLYRKYTGGSWTKVKNTTSTSFTDSGAKKGKKVTYTVRCIDKKGNTVSDYNKTGWSITRK